MRILTPKKRSSTMKKEDKREKNAVKESIVVLDKGVAHRKTTEQRGACCWGPFWYITP
jgi:hypothetical protein